MISPHTKPGTKVCCVNNAPRPGRYFLEGERPSVGAIYTVRSVAYVGNPQDEIVVYLQEIHRGMDPNGSEWGFGLERFRYLDLPSSITSCLNVTRLDAPNELERA